MQMSNYILTGVAGFIGSHATESLLNNSDNRVFGIDSLSYSGNSTNLPTNRRNFTFFKGDISEFSEMETAFSEAQNYFENASFTVINFAAESHVDRSIQSGIPFVKSNVLGVQVLLEVSAKYNCRRFVQISTDEVYGSLESEFANEDFAIRPSSAYAASKASADLLSLAYFRTHGLPVIITRSTNNFGTRQLSEKLIPRLMYLAAKNMDLPIYGSGANIREWIPVTENVKRILDVEKLGTPGTVYNIGSNFYLSNLEIAGMILENFPTTSRIKKIEDRLGHDFRYAVDCTKGANLFGWNEPKNVTSLLLDTMNQYWSHYKTLTLEEERGIGSIEDFYSTNPQ